MEGDAIDIVVLDSWWILPWCTDLFGGVKVHQEVDKAMGEGEGGICLNMNESIGCEVAYSYIDQAFQLKQPCI